MNMHWMAPALLDRLDQHRRNPETVRTLWSEASLLAVDNGGSFSTTLVDGPRLRLEACSDPYDPSRHWLLGAVDDRVLFMTVSDVIDGRTIRDVGAELPNADLEVAAVAVAIAEWHRLEPHCPQCGHPSIIVAAGSARHCDGCDRDLFPRTDPAVIVAVTDHEDRLLLGRQGQWPQGRFSVLAGFVEAGESFEQAIHREVYEEAGVRLAEVTYVGSQPWPFPRSIMVGFRAQAATTTITVDETEIAEARWVSREELTEAVAEGSMTLPTSISIAHRLISEWRTRPARDGS